VKIAEIKAEVDSTNNRVSANTSRTVSCQYLPNSGGLQFA
jgi:hypothetical protein